MSRTREFVRAIGGALQPAQAGNGGAAREHQNPSQSRDAISRFLFFCARRCAAPVDLCFVLGCPTPSTWIQLIELFRKGWTPKILIPGYGRGHTELPEYELFRRYALERHVPESALLIEPKATKTLENFTFSRAVIESELGWERIKRVALVTKPFHMRCALMTAQGQWPDHLEFIALPAKVPGEPLADTWWQNEDGRGYVFTELRAMGVLRPGGKSGPCLNDGATTEHSLLASTSSASAATA